MNVLYLLLLFAAAVCFAVAAFTGRDTTVGGRIRLNLVPLGLFCWVLVALIQHIRVMDA